MDDAVFTIVTTLQAGGDAIRSVGLAVFFVQFVRSPELLHGRSHDLYSIAFFTDYGVNIYFRNVVNRRQVQCEVDLFVAALSAMFSILREGTGLEGDVEKMDMSEYDVLFFPGKAIGAVICERATAITRGLMERVVSEFRRTFDQELSQRLVNRRAYQGAGEIIQKYIPYLAFYPKGGTRRVGSQDEPRDEPRDEPQDEPRPNQQEGR